MRSFLPSEDDAEDRGRGEEEMELQQGDDLAHDPVQAPEGGPQRGPGRDDRVEGEASQQSGNQQRQIEEELNRGKVGDGFSLFTEFSYLITLVRNIE